MNGKELLNLLKTLSDEELESNIIFEADDMRLGSIYLKTEEFFNGDKKQFLYLSANTENIHKITE